MLRYHYEIPSPCGESPHSGVLLILLGLFLPVHDLLAVVVQRQVWIKVHLPSSLQLDAPGRRTVSKNYSPIGEKNL